MPDTIDAEYQESTAIVAAPQASTAIWTPSFATRVDDAIEMKREKKRFFESVMEKDLHYGVVPGAGTKPTLYKPGAEMLLANMGLNPSFEDEGPPIIDILGVDHGGEPFIYYRRECRIYRQTGPKEDDRMIVGKASGACSSWETKYRYRNASLTCPNCGKDTIKKSKYEDGKAFYCYEKIGGCNAKFDKDVFAGVVLGKVPNPDIADVINTILKMADKRALVAATIISTGCSDIFTQDVEDMPQPDVKQAPVRQPSVSVPSIQSLMSKAKSKGLCTDGASFCAWAAQNVFWCENFKPGVKPTAEQCLAIQEALK